MPRSVPPAARPRRRICRRTGRSGPAVALLALALAGGCAAPPVAEFRFVARDPGVLSPEILRRDVEGEWCFSQDLIRVSLRPPWRARLADRGRAVADALAKIPEANVLTDVRVWVRVEQYLLFQRVCSIVRGDAGRLR